MARAPVTLRTITSAGRGLIADEIAIAADGVSIANAGRTYVILHNTTAGAVNVTFETPAQFDTNLALADRVISVAANDVVIAGPFRTSLYNQAGNLIHADVAIGDINKIEIMAFAI